MGQSDLGKVWGFILLIVGCLDYLTFLVNIWEKELWLAVVSCSLWIFLFALGIAQFDKKFRPLFFGALTMLVGPLDYLIGNIPPWWTFFILGIVVIIIGVIRIEEKRNN